MKTGRIVALLLLLASLLVLLLPAPILAQEEPSIELEPKYRKLEAASPGANFEFEVTLRYLGSEAREFDLSASAPQNWSVFIKPSYGEQRIGSIRLEPFTSEKVKISASPPFFVMPEPGEYEISLEVSSGELSNSIDLTAVITATYSLALAPVEERLNTTATAGKDNFFAIVIGNGGSGTIENIKFSSRKPDGWSIEFTPEKIDELTAGSFQTIDVNIKPAPKTIAGDYEITLVSDAKQTVENIKIRVTVETPTIWGWVGIAIIVVVIAGVIAVFWRFSRR